MPASHPFSVNNKFNQLGIIHLWLILIIIGAILGIVVFGGKFNFWIKPSPPASQQSPVPVVTEAPSSPTSSPVSKKVDKNDLEALEKYCMEEALKLPEVSFTYKSKEGPTRSGPNPWVNQFIPKDKKETEKKGCTMTYRFDGRTAYGQMGAEYPMQGKEFDRTVRANLASKLDSSWEKVSGPNISNDSFNMVYKRENPQTGTVDFVDAFDGGLVIYVKFNTYYK